MCAMMMEAHRSGSFPFLGGTNAFPTSPPRVWVTDWCCGHRRGQPEPHPHRAILSRRSRGSIGLGSIQRHSRATRSRAARSRSATGACVVGAPAVPVARAPTAPAASAPAAPAASAHDLLAAVAPAVPPPSTRGCDGGDRCCFLCGELRAR